MSRSLWGALLSLAVFCGCATQPPLRTAGESVLLVLAHPDDESMMGGTLGRLKEAGFSIDALYVTAGEGGKTNLITGDPSDLRRLRPQELKEAAQRIGIRDFRILGEPDEPLRENGKPTKDARRFLAARIWNQSRIEDEIEKQIAKTQPEIILTLLPENTAIHAHHQAVGRMVKALAERGRLGSSVQEIWAVTESHWYPQVSFKVGEFGSLEVDPARLELKRKSAALKMSYAEFQAHAAAAHVSQQSGHQGIPLEESEEFFSIWKSTGGKSVFKALLE